jgi:hypothetical protein
VFTNRLLLYGIVFELLFTAALMYTPALRHLFGTVPLPAPTLAMLASFPLIVWAVDEFARWRQRRSVPTVPTSP